MRIVIDTGVLIGAAIKTQTVPNIAVHQAAQRGALLKSDVTEAEFIDVIDRPYLARLISPAARDRMLRLIASAEPVAITERFTACRDPKDGGGAETGGTVARRRVGILYTCRNSVSEFVYSILIYHI